MATRGRTGIFPHRIDQTTDANAFVDYEHREVHVGGAFYYTVVATLQANGVLDRFIRVPNTTRWPHFEFLVEATSLITVQLYEGAAGASAAETVRNRNRNFADNRNTTTINLAADPVGGTLIWQWKSGVAAATPSSGKTPLIVRDDEELVLKQATNYLFRVTSGSNANAVAVYFTWYEHTNIEN